jgi:hypothetical protein
MLSSMPSQSPSTGAECHRHRDGQARRGDRRTRSAPARWMAADPRTPTMVMRRGRRMARGDDTSRAVDCEDLAFFALSRISAPAARFHPVRARQGTVSGAAIRDKRLAAFVTLSPIGGRLAVRTDSRPSLPRSHKVAGILSASAPTPLRSPDAVGNLHMLRYDGSVDDHPARPRGCACKPRSHIAVKPAAAASPSAESLRTYIDSVRRRACSTQALRATVFAVSSPVGVLSPLRGLE